MDTTVIVVLVICTLVAALAIRSLLLTSARKAEKTSEHPAVSEARHESKVTPRGADPEAVLPIVKRVQDNR